MAMNLLHQRRCSSAGWADMVRDDLLPWALADVELGDQTLEIGPGYGATLRALVDRAGAITAVEVDKPMAERLDRLYGDRARVVHGDGSNTGLPDTSFASVVCFTMLHHVPTDQLQDSCSRRHFEFCGLAGCLRVATACRHCRSGSSISEIPTTRSDQTSWRHAWAWRGSPTFARTWRASDCVGAQANPTRRHAS